MSDAPDDHLESEYDDRFELDFVPDTEDYEPSPYDGTHSEE